MWIMKRLFGEWPKPQAVNNNLQWSSSQETSTSVLIEEMDPILEWRIKAIVTHLWESMKPDSGVGKIIEQTHNSIINTTVSKIEFRWVNQDACLVIFNDRIGDDDFEVEWDMDHSSGTENDVYAVRIHESGSFRVERWHPDENNILHFRPVPHEETAQMISFVQWCMDLTNINIT
jgi:hypothetical protein